MSILVADSERPSEDALLLARSERIWAADTLDYAALAVACVLVAARSSMHRSRSRKRSFSDSCLTSRGAL